MNERRKTQVERIPPGLSQALPAAANGVPSEAFNPRGRVTEEFRPVGPAKELPADQSAEVVASSSNPGQEMADCQDFAPLDRPPTALLCVFDDRSRDDGEWIRIRVPRFTLGRTEGDLLLPHDDALSAQHVEIGRHEDGRNYRWYLQDLQSTNGTFVRAAQVVLKRSQQFMIGRTLFGFELPEDSSVGQEDAVSHVTRDWRSISSAELQTKVPALVELSAHGSGTRHLLTHSEMLLGSDPRQCQCVIKNDPFVSPVHAAVQELGPGRWIIKNLKSRNGLWVRIEKIWLDSLCEFQIGEQRCLFKLP